MLPILAIIGCGGSGSGGGKSGVAIPSAAFAPFKFFNAFPEKIPARLEAYGGAMIDAEGRTSAGLGEILRYVAAPGGSGTIGVRSTDADAALLASTFVDFEANRHRFVIGFGRGGDRQLFAVSDEFWTNSNRSAITINLCDAIDIPGNHIGFISKDGELLMSFNSTPGAGDGGIDLARGPGIYSVVVKKPTGEVIGGPFSFRMDPIYPMHLIFYGSAGHVKLALVPGIYVNL